MLKSIPNFKATLTGGISAGALVAVINQEGADILKKYLEVGDWVYATVVGSASYEVIKITSIDGTTVALERGLDGTTATAHVAGSKVTYALGESAVVDIAAEIMVGVGIQGSGIVQVTDNGGFNYTIHADAIKLVSVHPSIKVLNAFPTYVISER